MNGEDTALAREEIDASSGPILLEFGAEWCPHCQAAQALITNALKEFKDIRHIKIEDGPGRKLGRSFRIKLWPTLIAIRNGKEIERVVRPTRESEIRDILSKIAI